MEMERIMFGGAVGGAFVATVVLLFGILALAWRRLVVAKPRTRHRLEKTEARLHIIEGLVKALDQMTQQNAALVEQSAAAAGSLKEQAELLARTVGAFRIEPSAA